MSRLSVSANMCSSFGNICLVCMREEAEGLVALSEADEDLIEYSAKLYFCMPTLVKMRADARYPQDVCGVCREELRTAYSFKQKCLGSMHAMSEMLKDKHAEVLVQVKQESLEVEEEPSLLVEQREDEAGQASVKHEPTSEAEDENGEQDEDEEEGVEMEDETPPEEEGELRDSALHPLFPQLKSSSAVNGPARAYRDTLSLYCALCDERFGQEQVAQHRTYHGNPRSVTCPLCKRRFQGGGQMERFFRHYCVGSRAEAPHVCSVCERRFRNVQALSSHCKTHRSQERQYECQFCHLYFGSTQQLNWHYRNGVHPDGLTNKLRHSPR